jgi:hypothetical protein
MIIKKYSLKQDVHTYVKFENVLRALKYQEG